MLTEQKSVKLAGKEYPIAWGRLALARFRSIPSEQRNVVGPGQLAQILWAAFRGVSHPYPTWEHVFAHVAEMDEAEYFAMDESLGSVMPKIEPAKEGDPKTEPEPEPSGAEKKSSS